MKRKLVMAVALLVAVATQAQVKKESKWSITPRIGMTVSDYAHDREDLYSAKVGFGVGAEAEYRISKLFGISAGVFYTTQGAKTDEEILIVLGEGSGNSLFLVSPRNPINVEQELQNMDEDQVYYVQHGKNYRMEQRHFDIPILANFHVWQGLILKAGLQYDHLMSARLKSDIDGYQREVTLTDGASGYTIVGPKEYFSKTGNMGVKKQFHSGLFSAPVGASYEYKNFELDARYHIGLSYLFGSHEREDRVRTSTFFITLGYKFHL